MTARVALAAPRRLEIRREDASIRFDANGRSWSFAAEAEPLLHVLASGPSTVAELCAATAPVLDDEKVRLFVTELARQGLVNVTGEPEA
jgi:hypothetical protein